MPRDASLIAVGQWNDDDDGCWIFRFNGFGYEPVQKVVGSDGKGTWQGQSAPLHDKELVNSRISVFFLLRCIAVIIFPSLIFE